MVEETSEEVQNTVYTTQGAVAAGSSASIIASLLTVSSPAAIWLMINQYQMLILLPLIGAFLPKNIQDFVVGNDYTMFSFSFLKVRETKSASFVVDKFDYEQKIKYLIEIGIESQSIIVNQLSFYLMICLVIACNAILFLILKCF